MTKYQSPWLPISEGFMILACVILYSISRWHTDRRKGRHIDHG